MEPWVVEALATARVVHLGTVSIDGAVRLVPFCFAITGDAVVGAVDHKPKRTGQLGRLDDIAATGRATVLVDHYDDDDWSKLWWVRIRGPAVVDDPGGASAEVAIAALVGKYPQYRERPPTGSVWRVAMDEVRWWRYR